MTIKMIMEFISQLPLFYLLESFGIYGFALSGMMRAKIKNFDVVGWYVIALVTAFGGGTMRDLILDAHPVYWISHWEYPVVILGMVCIIYAIKHLTIPDHWFLIPDTIGLSLFTLTGAQVAIQNDMPVIIVAILATMTATFGGVIRDVLCHEEPMIFQKLDFYATIAFSGALLWQLMLAVGINIAMASAVAATYIIVFRLLSVRYSWRFR